MLNLFQHPCVGLLLAYIFCNLIQISVIEYSLQVGERNPEINSG